MASLLFNHHADVLAAMYDAYMEVDCERELAEAHGLTLQKFSAAYSDADVVGIAVGAELAGGAIFSKNSMHIAIKRKFQSAWFRGLRPLLEYAFAMYGSPLKAAANIKNKVAIRFAEQVGCVRQRADDRVINFEIHKERVRYGRNC